MFATATVDGKPYALSRRRSTFGRDGAQPRRAEGHDRGQGDHAAALLEDRQPVRLHLQLGVRLAPGDRLLLAPGILPKRAPRARSPAADARHRRLRVARLPRARTSIRTTSAVPAGCCSTGTTSRRPGSCTATTSPTGRCSGSRCSTSGRDGRKITDNVGIMNRAATEDVRSPVWPVVSRVLHGGPAPSARDQQVVDILDDWVDRDAPRLDADGDALYDEPGPVIMDAALAADRRRGDVAGVRRPAQRPGQRPRPRRPRRASPTSTRTSARCSAIRSRVASTSPTAATARSRRAAPRCGRRSTRPTTPRRAVRAGSDPLAEDGVEDRLRPGSTAEHLPDDQPPDVPAGARVPERLGPRRLVRVGSLRGRVAPRAASRVRDRPAPGWRGSARSSSARPR